MTTVERLPLFDLISRTKLSPYPSVYSGTPVVLDDDPARALFPYPNHWRGDYRSACPTIEQRRAGWLPRVDYAFVEPVGVGYVGAPYCFETAPGTMFPCWGAYDPCVIPYAMV